MQLQKLFKSFVNPSTTENSLLLDALKQDDAEKLRTIIRDLATKSRRIFYSLTFIDLIRYLDLEHCKKLYELAKHFPEEKGYFPDPVQLLSSLTFESFDILQKVLRQTIDAKKQGLIQQYKIFRGAYYQKELEDGRHPKVKIRLVNDQIKHGVFAEQGIRPMEFVGEYTGVIHKRTKELIRYNNYCLRYPISLDHPKDYVIDAQHKGNFTRYINHSDDPNLEVIGIYIAPFLRIIFRSLRKIERGEQLSIDYGELFWKQSKENYEPIFETTEANPSS